MPATVFPRVCPRLIAAVAMFLLQPLSGGASRCRKRARPSSCFPTASLFALLLVISSERSDAGIILVDRFSAASAHASASSSDGEGSDDSPPTQFLRDDFSPVAFSVSASAGADGGSANARSTTNAQITLDASADTLDVTAAGTASGSAQRGSGSAGSTGEGPCLVLTFTLTDISYEFTATGQFSATGDEAQAGAELGTPANPAAVFSVTANEGENKPLSQSGRLAPGTYRLVVDHEVDLQVNEFTASDIQSVSAQCHFTLRPVGTPPASTPVHWINASGGSFQTTTNWNPQTVPGVTSIAIFDFNNFYGVNVGTAATDRLVVAGNGNVTFTATNYTVSSTLSNPASVVVDQAQLTLGAGELRNVHASIGPSGPATVRVSFGAIWTSSGTLRVGGLGTGLLAIADGGTVTSAGAEIDHGQGVLSGAQALWTSGVLNVGVISEGLLTIDGSGTVKSPSGAVGVSATGTGVVLIRGHLSNWDIRNGEVIVGNAGMGDLKVEDGGTLFARSLVIGNQTGGIGTVTLTGVNPGALPLASTAFLSGPTTVNGALVIENGAFSSHLGQSVTVGAEFNGAVTIRGADVASGFRSQMKNVGDLIIGKIGHGTLTMENNALAGSVNGSIAPDAGSLGDVLVQKSAWNIDQDLVVANFGTGNLNITQGGSVSANFLAIAVKQGAIGRVTVSGASPLASLLEVNGLTVGGQGDGGLVVSDGGKVRVKQGNLIIGGPANVLKVGGKDPVTGLGAVVEITAGDLIMSSPVGFDGDLFIREDGTLSCVDATIGASSGALSKGNVFVGSVPGASGSPARFSVSRNLTVGFGSVILGNGAIVSVGGTLRVEAQGSVRGTGTLSTAFRIASAGTIEPGLSPGTLTFESDFEQSAEGILRMQVAGLNAGEFDVLHITGDAILDGRMEVTFLDGYLPKTGDALPFLQVDGSVSGDFAQITFPQLAPGFQIKAEMVDGKYQVTALNNAVRLFARESFRGLLSGDPAAHAAAGFFTIHTTPRGAFSASFVLGGRNFAVSGKFNTSGTFSKTIPRKGDSPLTINLELAFIDGERVIMGTITDGAQSIDLSADRGNAFRAKNNPAPQAGKYTVLLPFDPAASEAPPANGIGTVTIRKSGAVRFAGALADGKRLSQGTVLSKSGEWPLYVLLYKTRGALFGTLQFQDKAGSDFDGMLHWSRPQTLGNRIQTSGFLTTLPAIGSRYAAPPARPALLDLPNGATATLSDADLTPALTKGLTLNSRNNFAVSDAGADKLSFSATTASGLLSARFIHPTTGLGITVQGVLFQKRNLGSGFFLRRGRIGSLSIEANP